MYDLAQATLTNLIQVIAIAGFGGCILHYFWQQHTTWMATYCPPVTAYTPDTQVEQLPDETEIIVPTLPPLETSLPQPEPEEDVWEGAVEPAIQPQRRLEVRHFSPILALPPAQEQAVVNLPKPEEIELIASLDVPNLRKLCDRHQIAWKHARGKNRHMNKQVMVFQLQQRLLTIAKQAKLA